MTKRTHKDRFTTTHFPGTGWRVLKCPCGAEVHASDWTTDEDADARLPRCPLTPAAYGTVSAAARRERRERLRG